MEECEITDERTIQRLRESRITTMDQDNKLEDASSSLEVREMTHWYTCNECYVSNMYSSKMVNIVSIQEIYRWFVLHPI